MTSLLKLEITVFFWLSLPVHSGSLKRINYLKHICLAHPLSFECFHCSQRNSSLYFYLLSLQLVLCRVAALKAAPYIVHSAVYILLLVLLDQQKYSEKSGTHLYISICYRETCTKQYFEYYCTTKYLEIEGLRHFLRKGLNVNSNIYYE